MPRAALGGAQVECIEAVRNHPNASIKLGPNQARGVAIGYWGNAGGESSAQLHINEDGTALVITGVGMYGLANTFRSLTDKRPDLTSGIYEYAREVGFPQINFDLIAGMLGETDANWKHCVDETVRLRP